MLRPCERAGHPTDDRAHNVGRREHGFLRCEIEKRHMHNALLAPIHASFSPLAALSARARIALSAAPRVAGILGIVTSLMAVGCGGGPADKLEGKWVGDRIDNVTADQLPAATAWVKATTFEFAGDKLTVTIPTETARKGAFKVAKVDGDKILLSVQRKDSATRDEVALTMLGDKTLRWDIGQSREVTLVRAQ
jgi:hypothetical protein